MKASVIVLSWNGMNHLKNCLNGLISQDCSSFEVIVVDNGSTDGSTEFVAEHYPQVRLIRSELNRGFAGGCNVGLRAAKGNVLVLVNQDVIVQTSWLTALVDALGDEQVGVAGAKLLEPDGRTLSHAGGYIEWPLAMGSHVGIGEIDQGQYDAATDVEYVTGASLATRRNVLDRIGLLDERFSPAFFEDVDLCWRARRAGWRVRYEPRAVALHDEGSSTRHHWPSRHYYHYRNRLLFLFKHFTSAQILNEFLPAERERISLLPPDELRAGRAALTEILAMWPLATLDVSAERENAGETEQLLEALRTLRELVVRRQGGNPALSRPRPPEMLRQPDQAAVTTQHEASNALADQMEALWEIHEHPFTSKVPILGRWIVAFRNLWNSVATKWYVRPLLSQQVQFNGAVVRALLQLSTNYWDDDALVMLLAERCGTLAGRIVELETHLAHVDEQLETLRGARN